MEYIAAVSGDSLEVDKVKSKLLESNPVLEGTKKFFSPYYQLKLFITSNQKIIYK